MLSRASGYRENSGNCYLSNDDLHNSVRLTNDRSFILVELNASTLTELSSQESDYK